MAPLLQQQLLDTLQRALQRLPQLERLLCFGGPEPGGGWRLLFDGSAALPCRLAATRDSELWHDPAAELRDQGAMAVHAVPLPGYLIVFVAGAGHGFATAEEGVLAAFSDLLAEQVEQATEAGMARLRLATQVAHDFARLRDFETGNHLERVSRITRLIAEALADSHGLSPAVIEQLSVFSRLHDIGKIGIPDAILLKPGRLSADEMAVMRTHVDKGLKILALVLDQHGMAEQPGTRLMTDVIRCHHERLDGSGYPAGLRGDQIPLAGRIVAVADVFDALTSRRPYRQQASVAEGLALVRELADRGQLDRACVEALEQRQPDLEELLIALGDGATP